MIIPKKKLKNGFELPVYGLGMGGKREVDSEHDRLEIDAIQATIGMGVTHIDTAEIYANGHAEALLGQAIKGLDRSKLVIATKVASQNHTYDGVLKAFEGSLKRIGTDYIDLYLLHRYPDPGLSLKDTVRALDYLIEQGAVKNMGVCNLSPERFREVQSYTNNRLVCDQVHYNPEIREAEVRGVLEYCQNNDAFLVAWRPLEKGLLFDSPLLNELAAKYGKTPAQIAINWLISQPNVVTISRTSNVDHLIENLGAIGWVMEDADIEKIRREFPNQKNISYGEPLDVNAPVQ